MTDTPNAAPAAEAPVELKSTDTREVIEVKAEAAKPEAGDAKPEASEASEAEGHEDTPEGGTDAPAAESPESKPKRLPRWMKERLDRERQVTEARTRAQVLEELRAKEAKPIEQEAQEVREKTLEDFDFDQDKWLEHKVSVALERKEQQQRADADKQKQAESAEQFKAKVDAFEERVGDGAWDDIVSSPVNTNPDYKPLVDLFLGDEHDLELAHHFATNLKEAERLIALPRLQMVREVAKLAEKFSGEQATPAPTLPKKTTNAPPPPKTVSGAGKPSVDIDSPDITPAQRIAEWKRKGSK